MREQREQPEYDRFGNRNHLFQQRVPDPDGRYVSAKAAHHTNQNRNDDQDNSKKKGFIEGDPGDECQNNKPQKRTHDDECTNRHPLQAKL